MLNCNFELATAPVGDVAALVSISLEHVEAS